MKQYEKYRDSNFEWIGPVPQHWKVGAVKHCFKFKVGFTPPTSNDEFYDQENGFDWVTISDIDRKFIYDSKNKISKKAIEVYSKEIVPAGSLLYSFKLSVGKVAFAGKDVFTNEAIFSILPDENLELSYYYYCLPVILIHNANENIYGAKIFNQEVIKNSRLPIPPKAEQAQIAKYLDYKTSVVNELIKQKERIIELLKEKKQSIINEAVTKGINPNAKMKYSNIEWLGDIPADWSIVPLKYLGAIKYGLGQPPKSKENGLPLIRATNVERGKIVTKDLIFVDPDDVPFARDPVLKENDIIVVRSGAYTADSAIIPKEFEGAITGYDMVIRAEKVNPKLLAFALLSYYLLNNQLFLKRMRSAQPHLNAEELGESFLLLPPAKEQSDIVNYLEYQTHRIDDLVDRILTAISKLKEYRQSMIIEAVTGKIDVRDWKPNKQQVA